jgi:hypothetical protein
VLNAIRDFFEQQVNGLATRGEDRHSIEVATAALLVETVRLDSGMDEAERAAGLCAVDRHAPLG